ncbi:MAG: FecR domain-containing protein, partial [Parvibaculaceae bacterium]
NVQIFFRDNTRLLIGPRSTLVIDRFLLRGGRSVRMFSIDVLRGTFRFISGSSRKSAYNITTANSTIRLKGTAFDVSTGSATLIAVYSGKASLCAYGRCETVDQYCGVARAQGGDVMELTGRSKARALRGLPYVASQARLAGPFRVDTSGCRSLIGDDPHRRSKQDRQGEKPTRGRPSATPGPTPQ